MTVRTDQAKYDYICELVEKTYPILPPVWHGDSEVRRSVAAGVY